MTREEHLRFCERCQNRKFDMNQGIVCGLTMKIADFENNCPDFIRDESVKEREPDQEEAFDAQDIKYQLPSDIFEQLRLQQNLPIGASAGAVAALVGAVLWALLTVSTNYQIGYAAIGIGALVGFAMRYTGKGMDMIFGIVGGALALLGCVVGNVFAIVGLVANEYDLAYFDALSRLDFSITLELLRETFSLMDLVFYALAAYAGYYYAFRKFTEQDIINIKNQHNIQ